MSYSHARSSWEHVQNGKENAVLKVFRTIIIYLVNQDQTMFMVGEQPMTMQVVQTNT